MTKQNPLPSGKQLVVLGCSAIKIDSDGALPAINLYDGPFFRVLRSYLRAYCWPDRLSVAVLSAKYGIIGGLSHITTYDQRMTPQRATELVGAVSATLRNWGSAHRRVDLVLGQDYLRSIHPTLLSAPKPAIRVVEGPIGVKLNRLHDLLREIGQSRRCLPKPLPMLDRPLYFLPDWDDFLDVDYDFQADAFSAEARSVRHEEHSITLMRPRRLCDGILVSLAQNLGTKGLLKRVGSSDPGSLAPRPVRQHFKLAPDQWAFGDCGAFSYVAEERPTITVEQAVSLYDLYEFDLGASVDHIPVSEITTPKGKKKLSEEAQRARVRLTRDNANRFIRLHRERGARFLPVGVVQGLGPGSYARQIGEYVEMGYRYLAIGGLVPRSDAEVRAIVRAVHAAAQQCKRRPWLHLLGIFRPSLQPYFRELRIGSFDSATYFRKAWLRSDQNYLGADGRWYAAIRVPPLKDPRTKLRLEESGVDERKLEKLESAALRQLRAYDKGRASVDKALAAVLEYDRLLERAELTDDKLVKAYRRTLEARPWRACSCRMCRELGIEILIFRGINRNKRRGAHNTLQLFERVNRNEMVGGAPNADVP
ncbi:MAG: hypothetical protein L0Z62_09530 [Gemmataceae bacterium]|nr:hypothetical protein [Gemmataceae bacterium]